MLIVLKFNGIEVFLHRLIKKYFFLLSYQMMQNETIFLWTTEKQLLKLYFLHHTKKENTIYKSFKLFGFKICSAINTKKIYLLVLSTLIMTCEMTYELANECHVLSLLENWAQQQLVVVREK